MIECCYIGLLFAKLALYGAVGGDARLNLWCEYTARLAIHYELGSACEAARDKPAALRHFTAVYGGNIDYRDVGERIQALKS